MPDSKSKKRKNPAVKGKKEVSWLRDKHRLVILSESTIEEKRSFRFTWLAAIYMLSAFILLFSALVIFITAVTPLRELIPGRADVNLERQILQLIVTTDSLETALKQKEGYLNNVRQVLQGNFEPDSGQVDVRPVNASLDTTVSDSDAKLRAEIEAEDYENKYSLSGNDQSGKAGSISSFFFFTPLKGSLTNTFDPVERHYGVDITAPKDEAIKATLDGMVVIAEWTSESGYVLGIQHDNNLFSFYKHNSVLLKKSG